MLAFLLGSLSVWVLTGLHLTMLPTSAEGDLPPLASPSGHVGVRVVTQ